LGSKRKATPIVDSDLQCALWEYARKKARECDPFALHHLPVLA
jgi:hypothetical protein